MTHLKTLSKVTIIFHLRSTKILLWWERSGARENQEIKGPRDKQNTEEEIKGTKQNSNGGVSSLCLGIRPKELFQELLTQRSRN